MATKIIKLDELNCCERENRIWGTRVGHKRHKKCIEEPFIRRVNKNVKDRVSVNVKRSADLSSMIRKLNENIIKNSRT